jgi:hypothetical protein
VVQEFILARDLQFQLADGIVPPALFENTFGALEDLHTKPAATHPFEKRVVEHVSLQCSQLFSYRRRRILRGSKHSDISLLSCVVDLAQGRDCQDTRDRLYAMLAVADDDLGIQPDYQATLSAVLNHFALQSLLTGDLSVLHASGIRPNHDPSLPSFAPSVADWVGMTSRLNAPELGFCAANMFPVSLSTISADLILLRGVRVDTVNRIYHVLPHIDPIRRRLGQLVIHPDFASWFMYTHNHPNATFRELPGLTTESPYTDTLLHKAMLRTVTLDALDLSKLGPLPCIRARGVEYENCDVMKFVDLKLMSFHKNRDYFQTAQGYFGLGPSWIQSGDLIVIFDGGTTPFILRNIRSEDGEPGYTWQLVGDCFLLGWMHGDYFGHTVVDEAPTEGGDNEQEADSEGKKYLVKEWFTLV